MGTNALDTRRPPGVFPSEVVLDLLSEPCPRPPADSCSPQRTSAVKGSLLPAAAPPFCHPPLPGSLASCPRGFQKGHVPLFGHLNAHSKIVTKQTIMLIATVYEGLLGVRHGIT